MMFILYPRPIHSLFSLSLRTYIVVDRFSRYVHFISFIHHLIHFRYIMPKSASHRYSTDKSSPIYLRPRKLFVDDDTADNDLTIRNSKSSNHIITTALARLTTRTPPSSSSHHTVVIRTTVQQTPLSANRKLQMIDVNVCQQENHLSIKRIKRQALNTCSPVFNKSTPVPVRRVR